MGVNYIGFRCVGDVGGGTGPTGVDATSWGQIKVPGVGKR